jgi:hypothetical protein
MRTLAAALVVAGAPVLALIVLAATGSVAIGPALVAIGATLVVALLLGLCWSRDLALLADSVRRIGADEPIVGLVPALPGLVVGPREPH